MPKVMVVPPMQRYYVSSTAGDVARRKAGPAAKGRFLMLLTDRTVLVIGGGSGIGYGVAKASLSRGSMVAAVNGALNSFVRGAAIELAPLRVNALSPGWVDTELWDMIGADK